jgi:conjugative transfer signal peptidase TraF
MRRRLLLFVAAPACGLLGLAASVAAAPGVLLVNESPSLPRGLYRRTASATPALGDIVVLAPPADARGYLASLGAPPDARLLKRVAATTGQRVCALDGSVRVEAHALAVKVQDRRGVTLPAWRDCRALDVHEIFVAGDSADSFDSRYFGPVRHAAVSGVYREVLTW